MTNKNEILSEKKGINKVASKGDKLQETVSNSDLEKSLKAINIDSVIKKTATNRSIWKVDILANFGKTDKSARRKLRALQLDYSKAVIRELKLNNKEAANKNMQALRKFYKDNLVDFQNYSNVSENVNPDKYKIIHTAYSFLVSKK